MTTKHVDHKGLELANEETNTYWRGFVDGKDSVKGDKIMSFRDETGFEMFLRSMGWELLDLDYATDYFTSYGTVSRVYKKAEKYIEIGLTDKGIKVLHPLNSVKIERGFRAEYYELPRPWGYEEALKKMIK